MSAFSQETWSITQPNYQLFQQNLSSVYHQLLNDPGSITSLNISTPVSLQLNIQFLQSQNQQVN